MYDWSARGSDKTVWIQFPALVARNDAFDFRLVSTFASFEAIGKAWDLYSPGAEAWASGQKIAGDVFESYVDPANFVNVRRKS